jgi:type I restriction enzyme S subunit
MNINQYSISAAQPGLSIEMIGNLRVPVPPSAEQSAIAAFLDRETAKIDALITEQQRLIELLKEKRQAVISHAVTKGLNPDAPMKDSGIDWLGEVPEHWSIIPLKRDFGFLTSGSRGWAEHYSDDGSLFIRIGNLTRDTIWLDLSDIQRVVVPEGTEGERTRVQPGDVLFSITAYLGSVAVAPENLERAYVSQHIALARLSQRHLLPNWVAYVTLSFIGKTYLEMQGYGGTKIQLSLDDIANLVMTVPDLEEQIDIVAFLERETAKLDALTDEAQTAITLLQERRTALISAAVTGKIDVSGQFS